VNTTPPQLHYNKQRATAGDDYGDNDDDDDDDDDVCWRRRQTGQAPRHPGLLASVLSAPHCFA
jgi:hypothetical protein